MSPITPGVKVTEVKTLLFAKGDVRRSPRNLTSDEGPSPPRALMVEQDTVTCVHAISFPVVDGDPVCVKLGDTVWRTRVERGGFGLWGLNDLPIQLRGGGLVETDVFLESAGSDGIKETESTKAVNVAGVFGHLERNLDV